MQALGKKIASAVPNASDTQGAMGSPLQGASAQTPAGDGDTSLLMDSAPGLGGAEAECDVAPVTGDVLKAEPGQWPAQPGPGALGVLEDADPDTCVHYALPPASTVEVREVLDAFVEGWHLKHYDMQADLALRDADPSVQHLNFLYGVSASAVVLLEAASPVKIVSVSGDWLDRS